MRLHHYQDTLSLLFVNFQYFHFTTNFVFCLFVCGFCFFFFVFFFFVFFFLGWRRVRVCFVFCLCLISVLCFVTRMCFFFVFLSCLLILILCLLFPLYLLIHVIISHLIWYRIYSISRLKF